MSTSLPRLAILSVSSLLLTVACSHHNKEDKKSGITTPTVKADPYDSHYGMPKPGSATGGYATKPKYKRIRIPVKTNAPSRYKVKKGDTLWDISNKFLKDPWFWPEIWDKNQKIKNPHLIYPGDLLYIYQSRRTVKQGGRVVEILVPQIRVERTGSGEPISSLAPFLAWPRVLDNDTIDKAPYIVDGLDNHLLIEEGQTVYIKQLKGQRAGQAYPVFHKGKALYDPETKERLGYEVTYVADATITQDTGDIATATILNTKREVRIGDRLLKNIDEKVVLNAPMVAPPHKVRATVLSLYDANLISGKGMIIALDCGTQEGVKPGHMLSVFAPGKTVNDPYEKKEKVTYKYLKTQVPIKVDLPPERVATAVVYKVGKKMSYALITKSKNAVKKGYKVGNP